MIPSDEAVMSVLVSEVRPVANPVESIVADEVLLETQVATLVISTAPLQV